MIKISKLTDYGTVVLAELASHQHALASASELSNLSGINLPTVSKILKILNKANLIDSVRGANGGYKLLRKASEISAADVIDAFEGPLSITACSSAKQNCKHEPQCLVGPAWQNINASIRSLLEDITILDLQNNNYQHSAVTKFAGMPINIETKVQ
jgi:FeS assembly SUF system regulator|tara:strand:+ start:2113 stop:2580 length:468 start_codon:yes stop_codon:yes gene_type:complete